jgi:acyl-CoA synthetase (AMP-forming)/AMP-acid ligase II
MRGLCGRELLGMLDADGYLWLRGRGDGMVRISGATVYPPEVETAVRALPGVATAHVADLPVPGGARRIGALVVAPGPGRPGEVAELAAGARARLGAFKVPTSWPVVRDDAAVPRLASDKLDVPAPRRLLDENGVP